MKLLLVLATVTIVLGLALSSFAAAPVKEAPKPEWTKEACTTMCDYVYRNCVPHCDKDVNCEDYCNKELIATCKKNCPGAEKEKPPKGKTPR